MTILNLLVNSLTNVVNKAVQIVHKVQHNLKIKQSKFKNLTRVTKTKRMVQRILASYKKQTKYLRATGEEF